MLQREEEMKQNETPVRTAILRRRAWLHLLQRDPGGVATEGWATAASVSVEGDEEGPVARLLTRRRREREEVRGMCAGGSIRNVRRKDFTGREETKKTHTHSPLLYERYQV